MYRYIITRVHLHNMCSIYKHRKTAEHSRVFIYFSSCKSMYKKNKNSSLRSRPFVNRLCLSLKSSNIKKNLEMRVRRRRVSTAVGFRPSGPDSSESEAAAAATKVSSFAPATTKTERPMTTSFPGEEAGPSNPTILEPILRLLNLQLQRQRCSMLGRFYAREKYFLL
jgi:hypothetical protein